MKQRGLTLEQLALLSLSHRVWDDKGKSKSLGQSFGEETITDNLFLQMGSYYPGSVSYVKLNKRIEGMLGADWAWNFESSCGTYSFPMMVQAKMLDDQEMEYTELLHTVGKLKERQIKRLQNTAARMNFPAFYAFFNHLSDVSRVPEVCKSLQGDPRSWGISLASASNVSSILDDISFDGHKLHSLPLHCLLCSGGRGTRGDYGSPGRILDKIRDWFGAGAALRYDERHPLFEAAERLQDMEGNARDRFLDKVRYEYPKVDGVIIFKDGINADRRRDT